MQSEKNNNWQANMRRAWLAAATAAMIAFPVAGAHGLDRSDSEPVQAAVTSSRLRITGDRTTFTVDSDHADVLACLKSLFSQAGKQFDADPAVGGQITLQLNSQPLEVVLASVCKQAFVKYHVDPATGIWHFEADDVAIKAAFKRIRDLNEDLKQQLRALGLDVPQIAPFVGELLPGGRGGATQGNALRQGSPSAASGANGPAGPAGGGFGGGLAQQKHMDAARANPAPNAAANSAQNGLQRQAGQEGAYFANGAVKSDFLPDSFVREFLSAGSAANSSITPEEFQKQYGAFLKQSGLVAINTNGNAVPMSDLFAELSRQSGTPILLDPSVPRGSKFRINLSLPACTLSEALNIILPAAHLRWRALNGTTYVSATPDFQLFFGTQMTPGVIYGNSSNAVQGSQRGGQQNTTGGGRQN
jgi:hypothetical protein